jgi:glycosyltransferase involved in cell wall biosynthesis
MVGPAGQLPIGRKIEGYTDWCSTEEYTARSIGLLGAGAGKSRFPLHLVRMSRPLRFCMITTFYPPYNFGGDGIFVQQLSHELARRGHHVEVIHCAESYRLLAGREPDPGNADAPGVTVHRLRSPFGFVSPLATQQTGRPLFKATPMRNILAGGFDVIHYHNASLIGGPGVLEEGAAAVKLYTAHDYWLVCPTHMLFKYERAPCTRPNCVPCTLVHRRPPQLWRYSTLLRRAAKHVDVFITASQFVLDKHREMGFAAPMVVVPYFTARKPALAPNPGWPPGSGAYFLSVGRLERVKGLQTLIPLFRRSPSARLLVAGTGTYEASLRRLADGAPNILFLGHQTGERLGQLYAGATALIVPSQWYEVFGIVILEAFAQRTPVIVRNIGGMPAIIAESGGGFVYDSDADLVAAMDRLLADPGLRTALGLRGYQSVQGQWSVDAHIERYLGLIEEVAAAHAR